MDIVNPQALSSYCGKIKERTIVVCPDCNHNLKLVISKTSNKSYLECENREKSKCVTKKFIAYDEYELDAMYHYQICLNADLFYKNIEGYFSKETIEEAEKQEKINAEPLTSDPDNPPDDPQDSENLPPWKTGSAYYDPTALDPEAAQRREDAGLDSKDPRTG